MTENSQAIINNYSGWPTALKQVQRWGAKVIDQLVHNVTAVFPDMKGFSCRNLLYMRIFAEQRTDQEAYKLESI